MNVNITVRDFNYGYKQRTSFLGEKNDSKQRQKKKDWTPFGK